MGEKGYLTSHPVGWHPSEEVGGTTCVLSRDLGRLRSFISRCQVMSARSAVPPDVASVLFAIPMVAYGTVVLAARPPRSAGCGPLAPLVGSASLAEVGGWVPRS
jgi:hypothetical protein